MQTGSEAATNLSQLTWRRHSARAARAKILSPWRGLAHEALFIALSPGLKAGSDLEDPCFWSSVRTKGTCLALTGDGTIPWPLQNSTPPLVPLRAHFLRRLLDTEAQRSWWPSPGHPATESLSRHSVRINELLSQREVILSAAAAAAAAAAKSLQPCPTLCDPIDGQPTGLPRPWDFPGKNTGVGCHFLLQCTEVKSESEVAQSCLTSNDPTDCSRPGSSIHGIV